MPPEIPKAYKDRSTGLVLFGVLEIIMGLFAGLMGIIVLFASSLAKMPTPPPNAWIGSIFYLGIGVTLIWLGIGSIRARRWARALLLILSAFWLIVGLIACVALSFILPNVLGHLGDNAASPEQAGFIKGFVMFFVGAILLVVYVLIPGTLFLFYRSPNVKATCEAKNPGPSWTDHCPLPVLAMSLAYAFGCLMVALVMPFFGFLFPFFGTLLTGLPGALVMGPTLVLVGYSSWGFYKLKPAAWWVAMGVSIFGYGSSLVTFSKVGLLEMYQKMNFPAEEIERIRQTGLLETNFLMIETAIPSVLVLAYLWYLKRYFKASK